MAIWSTQSNDGEDLTIGVRGRFDINIQREFRDAFIKSGKIHSTYTIDMKETAYLDSSAFGVLLLLRDHAGGETAKIDIINCADEIKKSMSFYRLDQLFTIT